MLTANKILIEHQIIPAISRPKLSICIPTYNRERFLGELLESILEQVKPGDVEIVISDNASTDNTSKLVAKFQARYRNITYMVADQNMGPDCNYLTSVSLAHGDYCWLMGSDDVLPHGAVPTMLRYLSSDDDIYLTGRCEASYDLQPIRDRVWLDSNEISQRFDFSRPQEISRYFYACRSLGGLFSYLSSIIVKKSAWDGIPFDKSFIGSAYSHVYVLLSLVLQGCRLRYLTDPLVISRSGNDSFYTDWVSRVLIDFNGYHQLASTLLTDCEQRKAFLGVMRHEYSAIGLIKTKILSPSKRWPELKVIAKKIYKFSPWIFFLADFLYPLGRLLLVIKRSFKTKK
jgi:abequosyltransferase